MQDGPSERNIDIKISDLYGLIFYALLQRNYFEGAKQLIEAGGVRIHHILIGCVILEEKENDWRATQIEKEKMQQLYRIFSHHALRILRCIHANDNAERPEDKHLKNAKGQKEVGEHVQHAGRLLLNHGYLTVIIKTKNTTVLGDKTVKDILNQMWYGKESLSISRILLFTLLTFMHVIILPVLMITMEHKPLRW
ncbi:uncharacterized protein LOC134238822 [Saccostrea cucullata]|uniref:uncharacterized protein LOC134238822 n=1 Tax=Saccostrea cuccullata TaxID=36930 RepID=UPI002ED2086F